MIGRARRNYGGNRSSSSDLRNRDMGSWSSQSAANRNTSQTRSDEQPTRICVTCGLPVRVKTNGELGSHRVGTSAKRRWLCPGEDLAGTA